MIWKTTLAILVDKVSLFSNKNNNAQSSTFLKALTILLIFFGGFFNEFQKIDSKTHKKRWTRNGATFLIYKNECFN